MAAKIEHYAATVYSASNEELGTVVAESYDGVWEIALGMTTHPMLEWVQGGPTGKEMS
jgi:hypothetical protein